MAPFREERGHAFNNHPKYLIKKLLAKIQETAASGRSIYRAPRKGDGSCQPVTAQGTNRSIQAHKPAPEGYGARQPRRGPMSLVVNHNMMAMNAARNLDRDLRAFIPINSKTILGPAGELGRRRRGRPGHSRADAGRHCGAQPGHPKCLGRGVHDSDPPRAP